MSSDFNSVCIALLNSGIILMQLSSGIIFTDSELRLNIASVLPQHFHKFPSTTSLLHTPPFLAFTTLVIEEQPIATQGGLAECTQLINYIKTIIIRKQ